LSGAAGERARAYLTGRGLAPATWERFELGYEESIWVPTSQVQVPAISWPIYGEDSELPAALKYRFIQPGPKGERYLSLKGSQLSGHMFGRQSLGTSDILFLFEGEFNAMSGFEAAQLDVLSPGSESMVRLPAWVVDLAAHYTKVFTWFDRPSVARAVAEQLPRATPIQSPVRNGLKLDANELLQQGLLGVFLEKLLANKV
jgi:hypothetical protein